MLRATLLQVSHYIITCYLPSGMFVMVSWISFLIPPDVVPGRMTLLITIFLVLVNIFNTITTNIPKAEGLVEPLKIDSLHLFICIRFDSYRGMGHWLCSICFWSTYW